MSSRTPAITASTSTGRGIGFWTNPLVDKVPVVVERSGDVSQLVEVYASFEGKQQHAVLRCVVEQSIDELGPSIVEGDRRADLVEDLDAWRQPRLDGVL